MSEHDIIRSATLQAIALVNVGWRREEAASIARNYFKLTSVERMAVLARLCAGQH